MGTRAGLGRVQKIAPTEFDPWTVQPVASRYVDYAIPARDYNIRYTLSDSRQIVSGFQNYTFYEPLRVYQNTEEVICTYVQCRLSVEITHKFRL